MQHKCISFFYIFYSFNLIVTYSLVHCYVVPILLAVVTNLPWILVVRGQSDTWRASLTVKRWDGDDREVRGKACESGRWVHDSLRKVPTVGHLRASRDLSPRCPTVGTFCMLSHTYSHFRTPFFLFSYHHLFVIVGRSVTLTAHRSQSKSPFSISD